MKKERDITQFLSAHIPTAQYTTETEKIYATSVEFSLFRANCLHENGQHQYNIAYLDHHASFFHSIDTAQCEQSSALERMHANDFYELFIVTSNYLDITIEGSLFRLPKGSACLFNFNTRHSEGSELNYAYSCIWISPEYLKHNDRDLNLFSPSSHSDLFSPFFTKNLHDSMEHHKDFLVFTPIEPDTSSSLALNGPEMLENLILLMVDELTHKQAGFKLITRGYLKRIFALLENKSIYKGQYVNLSKGSSQNLFREVRLYIDRKKSRVTGAELEEAFHYGYPYISKIFHKYSGKTITSYIHDLLVKEAAKQLLETDRDIGEITTQLGFTNRAHFNQLFREKYGCSPKAYRKENAYTQIAPSTP